MSRTKGGSTYDAWQVLKDGAWHTRQELEARCGENGRGRARELRYARYGGLTIEVRRQGRTSEYRIAPSSLAALDPVIVAKLNRRVCPVDIDPVDRRHTLHLSVRDLVLLVAHLENNPQLGAQAVANLWTERRPRLVNTLRSVLPPEITYPYDLFLEERA